MTHAAGMRRLTAMRETIRLAHILFEHMDSPVPVTVHQEPNRNRLSQIGALLTYGWIRHDHYRHVHVITPKGREIVSEILGMWADALSPLQQHELEPDIKRLAEALDRAFSQPLLTNIKSPNPMEYPYSVPCEGKSINELPERSEEALARAFRNDDEIQREVRIANEKDCCKRENRRA